jgi:hypothetical protein
LKEFHQGYVIFTRCIISSYKLWLFTIKFLHRHETFTDRSEMKLRNTFIFSTLTLMFSNLAFSQYYKTLPKGVRTVVYRNVSTEVDSSFNHTKSETPLSFEVNADVKMLESIDHEVVDLILETLKPYPKAYEKLDLGTYKVEASAEVEVDAYALGYGVTDRITAYMFLPTYTADVRMKYSRPKGNNYDEVIDALAEYTNSDLPQAIAENAETYADSLDVNASFLQSLVENGAGYEAAGDWHGEGLGDLEFGVMYNFFQTDNSGMLLSVGGVAPTGRVDDPDVLQDIGFGDGQWDAFVEFGGGYRINKTFVLNSWVRWTHQFETDKDLRVPVSADLNFGDSKSNFSEKLGNKGIFHFSSDIILNDWISFNTAYEYNHTERASYEANNSSYSYAESWLASNTESVAHNLRLTGELSTVTAFTKKKFILPASIKFMYQHALEGRNTPKAHRYEVEFKMFF